jgi:chromate transporter
LRLGWISFGGPAGQIAIMQTELVERRRWVRQDQFLHALNYCMLLPGPEAQQLAIYLGWLLHRTLGGVVAGSLFVLPSVFILWLLSYVYAAYGKLPWISAIFYGLKPAVTAIVVAAVIRIGHRALKGPVMWAIAGLAFAAIFFGKAPFPAIVFSAGVVGFAGARLWPSLFRRARPNESNDSPSEAVAVSAPGHARPSLGRALRVATVCLVTWLTPTLVAGWLFGWQSTLFREGLFFSKAAVVTFGGAYAVLPYVAQEAVNHFGWLHPGQMLDGLGLAETTPGPLIMVVQFVGFMGAWQHPETLAPIVAGTIGALLTTWATFAPCFLWVLVGAPYIERLRGHIGLTDALSAITAAVVGVILNLAVWFALHVFFPEAGGVDYIAIGVCAVALFGLLRWKWNVVPVVLACALFGFCWKTIFP